MISRRKFFKGLAALPIAAVAAPFVYQYAKTISIPFGPTLTVWDESHYIKPTWLPGMPDQARSRLNRCNIHPIKVTWASLEPNTIDSNLKYWDKRIARANKILESISRDEKESV